MSVGSLRHLPVQTFWMLHKNIDRISAERDQRTAMLTIQTQSSEGVRDLMKGLREQMGKTLIIESPRTKDNTVRTSREELLRISRLGDLTNSVYPG
jgi:hypothetical protein